MHPTSHKTPRQPLKKIYFDYFHSNFISHRFDIYDSKLQESFFHFIVKYQRNFSRLQYVN